MKKICACILLMGAAAFASARPIVIEESATLKNPDPVVYPQFGRQVATNGEYALVLGFRDETTNGSETQHRSALLFRRVSGKWLFQQVLHTDSRDNDGYNYPSMFAMEGNLAAVELNGTTEAWRLGASGWLPAGAISSRTEDIEISGETIVTTTGDCSWGGTVHEPNGTGGWSHYGLYGQPRGCDDEHWGGPADIDGDRLILGNANTFDLEVQEAAIWQRSAPAVWNRVASITPPDYVSFTGEVALRGDDYIVDAGVGAYVYRYPDLQQPASQLRPIDISMHSRMSVLRDSKIEKSGDFVFVREPSYDRGAQVINVYRANASAPGTYEHVAVLTPRGGGSIINSFDVSGNTVIASGAEIAYVFELPASFTNRSAKQDNFEAGSPASWTTMAGSQFSIAAVGSNHVYRQSSTAGDGRAILGNTSMYNQAIEAQVTPTAFDGNDRFVGLITRYQNEQNFFFVTLRSSNVVVLKRMRAGVITPLASAAVPVTLNRRYRLRLESIGSTHRVYVDGALLLEADDSGAPHYGSAGITMYRARADYDNVVVTPSPFTTVYADDFAEERYRWNATSGQWALSGGTFAQASSTGDGRALVGVPTIDQAVEARVRQTAWSPTGTAERWAGIVARYKDASNYYYLHLRSGGTVSLRKLVNGAITELATAPLAVSLNTQYTLRLEAVGNQLRGFVNGNLLLQTTDSSLDAGIGGLMTSKASAQFDDYLAYQP